LLSFIRKFISLKQYVFEDSKSPEYPKFKVDKPPIIIKHEIFDYKNLIKYFKNRYGTLIKPIKIRNNAISNVPKSAICPRCKDPYNYLYDNNGGKGQYKCFVCSCAFKTGGHFEKPTIFRCPYCGKKFAVVKNRKVFRVHKCKNPDC
jgi:DNA-directed RNA polymerase subunit RPC12/RpoP